MGNLKKYNTPDCTVALIICIIDHLLGLTDLMLVQGSPDIELSMETFILSY